jgi:hypothetical protein
MIRKVSVSYLSTHQSESSNMKNIAILGWGSLIWDESPEFDQYLKAWTSCGPQLPIEFCRKSKTRCNALTLVIDQKFGTQIETFYTLSKRTDPRDVIYDLRSREGTTIENIGFVNLENGEGHGCDPEGREVIKTWASLKGINFVAWTDLKSNFDEQDPDKFITAAIAHLKNLDLMGIREAVKYIVKAPPQTNTHLRQILMHDEWFKEQVELYNKDA